MQVLVLTNCMDINITKSVSESFLQENDIKNWSIWEKEVSEFAWSYDSQEKCYIITGRAEIAHDGVVDVIEVGDFVIFPVGLTCTWKITEPIKKYYNFG